MTPIDSNQPTPTFPEFDEVCASLKAAIDSIGAFQRQYNPTGSTDLTNLLRPHRASLKAAIQKVWELIVPDELEDALSALDTSTSDVLDVLDTILATLNTRTQDGFTRIMKTGRKLCQVLDRLYPHRDTSAHLQQLFLEPDATPPESSETAASEGTLVGLHHISMDEGNDYARGGFSFYVPECYSAESEWPLVVALHGGSGHGRDFVWTWLREARSRRFILLSPTSVDRTWSLMDPGVDGNRLHSILGFMEERYRFDMDRVLLTGMSDGGTYALIHAFQEQTPFTAFAPVSSVLPPYDLRTAEGRRIYWIHGSLDWMFPVYRAIDGSRSLRKAGVEIRFREIEDLSHTYPREMNGSIIEWFDPELVVR